MKTDKIKIFKVLIVVGIVLSSIIIIKHIDVHYIRDTLSGYPKLAPAIYVLLFSILPIFLFPVPILVLPAGLVFGLLWGTIYTLIGALINCVIMYKLGNYIGKKQAQYLINKIHSVKIRNSLLTENQKNLSIVFFILRLVSYNIINYISGLTNISLTHYIIATLIGILPGIIVFINVGDKLTDVKSTSFILSIIILCALILLSLLILRKFVKNEDSNDSNTNL